VMKVVKELLKKLDWIGYRVRRKLAIRMGTLNRALLNPQLPDNPDGSMLIHLGCGNINAPDFINVDIMIAPHIHYVSDVTNLSMFSDEFADLVYASHVLEHIPPENQVRVLWEWRRVLKKGGVLRLSVPGFDHMIEIYKASSRDIRRIMVPLLGRDVGYNPHCSVFNEQYLSELLREVGFSEIRTWNPKAVKHHDFDDWASKTYLVGETELGISLNLEAVK